MGATRKDKDFHKYQHIIRLGEPEIEGILEGTVHLFPKLDGTQRHVYKYGSEIVCAGHDGVLEERDKLGSGKYETDGKFIRFFEKYPNLHLFGEYLVPHEIRYYEKSAWNKLYIFDVAERIGEDKTGQSIWGYLTYEQYVPILEEFGIEYVELADKLENPSREDLVERASKSGWLTMGNVIGEGFVIKNYDFRAYNGRTLWGKLVWRELPELRSLLGKAKQSYNRMYNELPVEQRVLDQYLTESFMIKEYHKMLENTDREAEFFKERYINNTMKVLLEEEMYHIVKKFKQPTINFKELYRLAEEKMVNLLETI